MKKDYVAPKAEKMEFNYTEAVVASSTTIKCNVTPMTQYEPEDPCLKVPASDTVYND